MANETSIHSPNLYPPERVWERQSEMVRNTFQAEYLVNPEAAKPKVDPALKDERDSMMRVIAPFLRSGAATTHQRLEAIVKAMSAVARKYDESKVNIDHRHSFPVPHDARGSGANTIEVSIRDIIRIASLAARTALGEYGGPPELSAVQAENRRLRDTLDALQGLLSEIVEAPDDFRADLSGRILDRIGPPTPPRQPVAPESLPEVPRPPGECSSEYAKMRGEVHTRLNEIIVAIRRCEDRFRRNGLTGSIVIVEIGQQLADCIVAIGEPLTVLQAKIHKCPSMRDDEFFLVATDWSREKYQFIPVPQGQS